MIHGYKGTEVLPFPLIAYYLEGEHKILVDTGGCSPEAERGKKAAPYTRTTEQELDKALEAIGVKPEDIEYVIFTHIHWDHAGNNELFPNAKFLCQRKEFESVTNPDSPKIGYDLPEILKYKYELIDGDQQIFDGISAILTPGHTEGMQCLVVDTEEGKVVLTGDLITLQESFRYDPPVCNGLFADENCLAQMYEGVNKVAAITKKILPGHDPNVFAEGMGF